MKGIELNPKCDHFQDVYECLADCFNKNPETSRNGTKEI